MTNQSFEINLFNRSYDRQKFDSGSLPLNNYIKTQASQDIKRNLAKCYITSNDESTIAGYYTLSASNLAMKDIPAAIGKRLGTYPMLPSVLMGRLAVDKNFQGLGLAKKMLNNSLTKCLNAPMASFALMVDAKDEQAENFYEHYGFIRSLSSPSSLFLPMDNAKKILDKI